MYYILIVAYLLLRMYISRYVCADYGKKKKYIFFYHNHNLKLLVHSPNNNLRLTKGNITLRMTSFNSFVIIFQFILIMVFFYHTPLFMGSSCIFLFIFSFLLAVNLFRLHCAIVPTWWRWTLLMGYSRRQFFKNLFITHLFFYYYFSF